MFKRKQNATFGLSHHMSVDIEGAGFAFLISELVRQLKQSITIIINKDQTQKTWSFRIRNMKKYTLIRIRNNIHRPQYQHIYTNYSFNGVLNGYLNTSTG